MTLTFSELTDPSRRQRLENIISSVIQKLIDEAQADEKALIQEVMAYAMIGAASAFGDKFQSTSPGTLPDVFERNVLDSCNRILATLRGPLS